MMPYPDCNNKNEAERTLDTSIPLLCTEECFVTYLAHLFAPYFATHGRNMCIKFELAIQHYI